jgi:hypothetical protein
MQGRRGLDSFFCLAETFELVVSVFLTPIHMALNQLLELCTRIPLTEFLHCPGRLYPQMSTPWIHSPSFCQQFWCSTLQHPPFWLPEGCILRTQFFGWQWAETQRVWRAPVLHQRVLCSWLRGFHAHDWKTVFVLKETLLKNLSFEKDILIIYVNLIITLIIISEKK